MSRELFILRHAKSNWKAKVSSDFDRPLAERGLKDAPRMGTWLYREGMLPGLIMSSPAVRARDTALKVCKTLDLKKKSIHWEPRLYEADLATLLNLLAEMESGLNSVLLIGHNPGLEELLRHLVGSDLDEPEDGKLLPTAALARLEMPADWTRLDCGCANLISLVRPKQLR